MPKASKLYFYDAAGKFDAMKDEAHATCRNEFDLTIYSLTPIGKSEPARLILKMTPIGEPDGYMSMQAGVSMFTLNYQAFPARGLKDICSYMNSMLRLELISNKRYTKFGQGNELFRKFGRGSDLYMVKPITIESFFSLNPREDEPGAQIYLRDKTFFLSALADPERPDFAALPLLTDTQRVNVTAIDLSKADVSGRRVLSRLFKGCQNVSQLDLSAFDTSDAVEMEEMFFGCQSLRRLDLSTFDFSQVKHLKNMFDQCRNLEEVILSDTILNAGRIPHATGRSAQVLKHNYYLSGPYPKEYDYDVEPEKIFVSFAGATDEEIHEHMGLSRTAKLRIVPHQALKKG